MVGRTTVGKIFGLMSILDTYIVDKTQVHLNTQIESDKVDKIG